MQVGTKKLISLPKLLKRAERVFNAYIRRRDENEPCISCGARHNDYDAGHYVPVSKSSFLRFNEWNCNKEGKSCNAFDSFHLIGYKKRLIEKIGIDSVMWLEENRFTMKKWTRDELMEIINKYK